MKRLFTLFAASVLFPAVSQAHFLWLVCDSQSKPAQIQVYFGESAEPDDPALLEKVAAAELWTTVGRGQAKSLTLQKSAEALTAQATQPGTLFLRHSYGVVAKGGEPFMLKYYAKAYPSLLPGTWQPVGDKERLPLEVSPVVGEQEVKFTVTWQGKPQAGAAVTVTGPGIPSKLEGTTDAAGVFACQLAEPGKYSIRAKHVEGVAGQLEGKEYKSVRHYSTLTLHHVPASLAPVAHSFPALPKGTTSFGGAVVGDTLFVYGGNYGSAHEYANEDQSGDLWKLELSKPGVWEQQTGGMKLQGLAMVEHRGWLYRVGGFTATNKGNEGQNLISQADFARFNPAAGANWETLPSLPQPRSSHDAAVVGDTLYVAGGWNMQGGGQDAQWHDTALSLQLGTDKPEWKAIAPPPFQRRALALAGWRGKLYCLGGMQEKGGPTTAVTVFDPETNSWSDAPALLGGPMDGFGCSAFACQDALFVTTMSGSIQRLSGEAKSWEFLGQLTQPRFFHRLLPWQDGKLIVVGGASMSSGKAEALELLDPTHQRSAAQDAAPRR